MNPFFNLERFELTNAYNILYTKSVTNRLNNLKNFTLVDCNLKSFKDLRDVIAFYFLDNIIHLDLSRNQITKIEKWYFTNVITLLYMSFARNSISFIENHSFKSQKRLVTLDLSYNLIMSIERDEIFAINLYLNTNKLVFFDNLTVTVTGNKPELNLLLSSNNLTRFPTTIVMNKLVCNYLSLSNNMISRLPYHSKKKGEPSLIRIVKLYIKNNSLKEISENSILNKFKLLEVLELSENSLTELKDKTFKEQFAMKILDLSHNKLTYITRALFFYNNKLEWLDLSYNQIYHIEEFAFERLTMLKTLHLNSNDDRLILSEQLQNSSIGLTMLRRVSLSGEILHSNSSNLEIVMSLFGARSKLYKDMFGVKFLYSNRIDYTPNYFNYTVDDCFFILQSIRKNVLLNMSTKSDLDAFLAQCKFIDL